MRTNRKLFKLVIVIMILRKIPWIDYPSYISSFTSSNKFLSYSGRWLGCHSLSSTPLYPFQTFNYYFGNRWIRTDGMGGGESSQIKKAGGEGEVGREIGREKRG